MKKLLIAGAASLFALCAAPAYAAVNLTTSIDPEGNGGTDGFFLTHTLAQGTGTFLDQITFSLSAAAIGNGSVDTLATLTLTGLTRDIDFLDVYLNDALNPLYQYVPNPLNTDQEESWTLPLTFLAAGNYTIFVSGRVDNAPATYTGTFNISNAIPEPSTWALMLLGFGAVGYSLRQRKTYKLRQAV